MGDPRRFSVTADFIARNFRPCKVADVAGGKGLLSVELRERGFKATVLDTRGPTKAIKQRGGFKADMAAQYDLAVGLHPDGATEELAKAALLGKPVVIVPCCFMWRGIESHGAKNAADCIRRLWKQRKIQWWETQLPMSGKNVVLVANHRQKEK